MSNNPKATVFVRLKDGVLDPQGVTIHKALAQMGYDDFLSVKSGRFFELELKPDRYAWDGIPSALPSDDGLYPCAIPGVTKVL